MHPALVSWIWSSWHHRFALLCQIFPEAGAVTAFPIKSSMSWCSGRRPSKRAIPHPSGWPSGRRKSLARMFARVSASSCRQGGHTMSTRPNSGIRLSHGKMFRTKHLGWLRRYCLAMAGCSMSRFRRACSQSSWATETAKHVGVWCRGCRLKTKLGSLGWPGRCLPHDSRLHRHSRHAHGAERDLGPGQSTLQPVSVPDRLQGEGCIEPLL